MNVRSHRNYRTLTDVEDLFVSDAVVSGFSVARLVFASDGKIFIRPAGAPPSRERLGRQRRPASDAGHGDDGAAGHDEPGEPDGPPVFGCTYTMTPLMFTSALVQYNSSRNAVSTNIRFRWEYQPGSERFILFNEERDTGLTRS